MARVPATLYGRIVDTPGPGVVDAIFHEVRESLERKGQLILYGPPGTGKTYTARRFAIWWLQRKMGAEGPERSLADPQAFQDAQDKLSTPTSGARVWWIVANPKIFAWEELFETDKEDFTYGRLQRNYPLVQPGDLVVGYQASPDKRIMALARITRGLYTRSDGTNWIDIEPVTRIDNGLTYEELKADPVLAASEPMRFNNQGTLFSLSSNEAEHLMARLEERDPGLEEHVRPSGGIGHLTQLTFHPSYSYEDFIEGYRPAEGASDGLVLRLEDGIFKRVCLAAQAEPDRPYLVLIDEINRANVAKVLGEIITLLEKDKRGMVVTLPQSKDPFRVPPNVFILGTMNTADRSIKLLDVALRRRFAFCELMPDLELLEGATIGNLHLDEFLGALNRRIARQAGREKQIGHAVFLDDGAAIGDQEEFARRFRQEILPLLQEYCYEDYGHLAALIGPGLVDGEAGVLMHEAIVDSSQLVAALEEEFMRAAEEEET